MRATDCTHTCTHMHIGATHGAAHMMSLPSTSTAKGAQKATHTSHEHGSRTYKHKSFTSRTRSIGRRATHKEGEATIEFASRMPTMHVGCISPLEQTLSPGLATRSSHLHFIFRMPLVRVLIVHLSDRPTHLSHSHHITRIRSSYSC